MFLIYSKYAMLLYTEYFNSHLGVNPIFVHLAMLRPICELYKNH